MASVNKQLGEFLRHKRESLSPKDFGLPSLSKGRRTPGLRRGEVAELIGISVDWYMRLEQGRDSLPSKMTAEAIAKVFRLNTTERSHLLKLALGGSGRVFKKEIVPPQVMCLIQELSTPAYILGARYDILYWNQALTEFFRDFSKIPETERNLLYQMFLSREVRKRFLNWEKDAREMLENFRISYDLWAHSPQFIGLVEQLSTLSPEFRKWWKVHAVRMKASGETAILHKKLGKINFFYSTFQLCDYPDLKLILYNGTSKDRHFEG